MTQDRIIDMARQAGFHFHDAGYGPEVLHTEPHEYSQKCFERFAALVRAAALEEAAGVCEEVHDRYPTDIFPDGTSVTAQSAKMARITANNCAAAIRALKGQP